MSVGIPSADSFLATPRSQSVLEDFALPNISLATTEVGK